MRSSSSLPILRSIKRWSSKRTASTKGGPAQAKEKAIQTAANVIQSANSDLSQTRGELAFLLAAILFISITVLSIRDKDLLFGSHVQLPLLGLSMGFDAFLLGSPLLLVVAHFALLLKLGAVRAKCDAIHLMSENIRWNDQDAADALLLGVGSHFVAQWLIGSAPQFQRRLALLVYVLCLWAGPLISLLLITVRALPLHRAPVTGFQIACLAFDVWLLVLFHWRGRRLLVSFTVAIFVWLVCSITLSLPDSSFDNIGQQLWSAKAPFGRSDSNRNAFAPTAFLLENSIDTASGKPLLFFSRNLIVTDDQPDNDEISETKGGGIDKRKPKLGERNLRGRDLRYATLDRSNFQEVDFTLADLTGASLVGADLRKAIFGCGPANDDPVQRVWIAMKQPFERIARNDGGSYYDTGWYDVEANCTAINGANLTSADLRGAKFEFGQTRKPSLAGAQLFETQLDETDLSSMDLNLANLGKASLVGANLSGSTMVGATLTGADLTGANLSFASMHLAALGYAGFAGADLNHAMLVAADLSEATFMAADLRGASFVAARFENTVVSGANPPAFENFAWATVGKIKSKPDRWQLEQARSSLAKTSQFPNPDTEQRLRKLLETSEGEMNGAWETVLVALQKDRGEERSKTINDIITNIACSKSDIAVAVEFWSRPVSVLYTGGDWETPKDPNDAIPRQDKIIEELKKTETGDYGSYSYSYSFSPDTIIPLPREFDGAELIRRLAAGQCQTKGQAANELAASLIKNKADRKPASVEK